MERASAEEFYNFCPFLLESYYEIIAHKPFIFEFIDIDSQKEWNLLAIDRVLDAIHNGEWHEIKEITQKTKLKESQIELISGFLAAYDFLELDRKSRRMRLSPQLQHFLTKIREIEQGEVLGKGHASDLSAFAF